MLFNDTIQVDTVFIIAVLTVIGYGINDVIVIFDRIRENLSRNKDKNLVYNEMKGAASLKVMLEVDANIGTTWLDAK